MKLTDKRFWIWCVIAALIPVMMSVFTALILIGVDSASELFYYKNLEIFLIWEITYLLGGFEVPLYHSFVAIHYICNSC